MFEQRLDLSFPAREPANSPCPPAFDERNFVGGLAIGFQAGHGFDAPHAGGNRVSPTMRNKPISPVARVCVPPQSSIE
jgi:hypothetical protein